MFYKNAIYISLLAISSFGYCQTVTEVFQKMAKQYAMAKPLQYKSSYNLYKDSNSKKIEENYQGSFIKNSLNEIYMTIGKTEILNSKTVNIKISHPEKAIEISNPVNTYSGDFDMKPLLDLCKINLFRDLKTYWEITLTPNTFSGLTYSKIVVQISKAFFLQKQVFYYNTATNFSKDYRKPDLHYPRLEIIYTDFNRNIVNPSFFDIKRFYSYTPSTGIKLVEKLKKYEIIDQRTSFTK